MEHYASGLPVMEDGASVEDLAQDAADSETHQQIKQLLIRWCVRGGDGWGDIVFQGFDDGIVTLQMRGSRLPKFNCYVKDGN